MTEKGSFFMEFTINVKKFSMLRYSVYNKMGLSSLNDSNFMPNLVRDELPFFNAIFVQL